MLRHAMGIISLAPSVDLRHGSAQGHARPRPGAGRRVRYRHAGARRGAAKLGMTLIYSYSPENAKKQLDLNDPMGKAVAKHKMQVCIRCAADSRSAAGAGDHRDGHDHPHRGRKAGFREVVPGNRLSRDRG